MSKKQWPNNCPWPDIRYPQWGEFELEDAGDGEQRISWFLPELVEVKEYFDDLAENGIDYEGEHYELSDPPGDWEPDIGEEYWEDGKFDAEMWQDEFDQSMGRLKLYGCDAAYEVERIIGYDFADEKLIQQAFTRRAFDLEYGAGGNSEELEFFGDAALNYVLTRNMSNQYGRFTLDSQAALLKCQFSEGDMSKIRGKYSCKEYLAQRAEELGLDKYILYGTADEKTESAKEDMMEALIGAVAIDSDWNYEVLDTVVDNLLNAHLECPDRLLKKDFYEVFNSWHQKKWGQMPEYELYRSPKGYHCTLRFIIPENDKNLNRDQRLDVDWETRSMARSFAAEMAFYFLDHHGLWMNLSDSGIDPEEEKSINQLQELYQKKYIEEPVYTFEDTAELWKCSCVCGVNRGEGLAKSKTEAKKKAAFVTICHIFQSAGINKNEWKQSWEVARL